MIELPKGTRIWLAAGASDMRRGFDGLSAQVQHVLQKEPLDEFKLTGCLAFLVPAE